jgi:hypothetical protein
MKKIVFVGIILVSGLFSLQYSLFGSHGDKLLSNDTQAFETKAFCFPDKEPTYEVIYVCPEDSTQFKKKWEKAAKMLL